MGWAAPLYQRRTKQMMKTICLMAAAVLALACGGELGDEPELGTLEQGISVNEGHGFRTNVSGSNTRCLKPADGGSGQVCVFPFDKSVSFRATDDGISATKKAELVGYIDGALTSWPGQFPSWSLSRVNSGGDVRIRFGSLGGGPTTSIHTYARVTTVSTPGDFDDQGLPGLYRDYGPGGIVCTIDDAKIVADFTSPQEPRVRNHAVLYCMAKGLGLGSGSHFSRPDAVATTPDASKSLSFSNRSKCYVNNYNPTNPPIVTFQTACNSENDGAP